MSLFVSLPAGAQEDAVAVRIGTCPVTEGELAFAYKNYLATDKGRRKTVTMFLQDYIGLRRRALAAQEAHLDTASFIRASIGRQKARLLRPLYLTENEQESEALKIYNATKREFGGKPLLKVATIFRYIPQKAPAARVEAERQLMDSLYNVLLKGGDFQALASQYSSSKEAQAGYVPAWVTTGTTWRDYEETAYTLQPGEYSKPFLSVRGFYIVKLLSRQPFPTFEEVKPRLLHAMAEKGRTLRLVQEKFRREQNAAGVTSGTKVSRQEREDALLKANPAVEWQLRAYENALLAAEWNRHPDLKAQDLSVKYPAKVNDKTVHALEQVTSGIENKDNKE